MYSFSAAIATAYPNGHLGQRYTPTPGNCPPSPSEDPGGVAMRPVYPRTQYQMQYGPQGPPRVNAGDIGNTSSKFCDACFHNIKLSLLVCYVFVDKENE